MAENEVTVTTEDAELADLGSHPQADEAEEVPQEEVTEVTLPEETPASQEEAEEAEATEEDVPEDASPEETQPAQEAGEAEGSEEPEVPASAGEPDSQEGEMEAAATGCLILAAIAFVCVCLGMPLPVILVAIVASAVCGAMGILDVMREDETRDRKTVAGCVVAGALLLVVLCGAAFLAWQMVASPSRPAGEAGYGDLAQGMAASE